MPNDHGLGDALREARDALETTRTGYLSGSIVHNELGKAVAKIEDLIRQNDELNTAPTEDASDALAKLLAGYERRIARLEGAPTEIHVHQHTNTPEDARTAVDELVRRIRAIGGY